MDDTGMTPDELAWAFHNAPPEAARPTTSQAFAAAARAREEELIRQRQALQAARLDERRRQLERERRLNEAAYPQAQYLPTDQVRPELGAYTASPEWKQGFFAGLVGGLVVSLVVRSWLRG